MSAIGPGSVTWKYGAGSNSACPLPSPSLAAAPLALRAMPVAAAVVRDDCVRAALAARDMAAERDGAAALDRTHDLHLVEAEVAGIGGPPRRPLGAGDIRHPES